ncbi:MAG: hypothetical protein ACK55I_02925, partial [bacterium]
MARDAARPGSRGRSPKDPRGVINGRRARGRKLDRADGVRSRPTAPAPAARASSTNWSMRKWSLRNGTDLPVDHPPLGAQRGLVHA